MNPHAPEFHDGDKGDAAGLRWRVVRGHKAPDDLVIEWLIDGCWRPVSLVWVFIAVDLICQNEDRLYPYPGKGGQKVIRAISDARLYGHEYATGQLALERENRNRRAGQDWAR